MTVQQAFDLAVQHHQSGRLPEAEAIYRQILAIEPLHANALHLLGVIAHQVGQNMIAVDLIQQAIALTPGVPDFHANLGEAYRAGGQLDEAIGAFRQAIALKPQYPAAHSNLGNVLREIGQLEEAVAACRQAIALQPAYPEAHNNLGVALQDKGLLAEAITAFRQAIALQPDYPGAHTNLGGALYETGQIDEAMAAFHEAIAHNPNYADAQQNLAGRLRDAGQLDESISAFRKAIALQPADSKLPSYLLFTLNCHPGTDFQTIAEENQRWNLRHAEPLRRFIQPHRNDCHPDRRLRIGYVSADFREHPVGRFVLPLLANHDHHRFEIFAYAQVPTPDGITERLRAQVDAWRSLNGLSDAQAADLIRQDGIDLLVDVAGHTANNRLLIFAHKPAPIQVTWLGYPNTTGLGTMDYRLTDAFADPLGRTEPHYSEALIRLAPCAWCFAPTTNQPVTARTSGPITFGCFNSFAKVNDALLQLWTRILHAVPDSRLLLKSGGLASATLRQRVRQVLAASGIAPERLELRGFETRYHDHLALYERVDIALDTYPYHGTTTTCEALWMGVPVVSLAGDKHVSRVGVSLLTNAGLPELVVETPDDYVRVAAGLASDLPRLAQLRATMRDRLERSPLMDAPRFARDIEAAYREMWRKWCAKAP